MKYLKQSLNTCIFYREPVNTDEPSFDDGVCGNSSSNASVLSAKGNIDVVQMMKETLPPYMVNCLVAAGYDDFDAISTMNISENYGNSIRKIEDYIDVLLDHDQTKSLTPPAPYLRPFRFPPGHRVKLCNFVQEIKSRAKLSKKKLSNVESKNPSKRRKLAPEQCIELNSEDEEISILSVSNQIRSSIRKWIHKQSEPALRQLEEGKHYKIIVSPLPALLHEPSSTGPQSISASVRCLVCNTAIILHRKDASDPSLPFILSNWTKHSKSCYVASQEPALVQKQKDHHPKLDRFFRTSTTKHKEKAEEALHTAEIVDVTDGHEILSTHKSSQQENISGSIAVDYVKPLVKPPESLEVEQVFQQAPPSQ